MLAFDEIVKVGEIGCIQNYIQFNELMEKAKKDQFEPSFKDLERVLFIGIDYQQDFMDNGALGVPGANKDVERVTKWLYDNMSKITNIAVSLDSHNIHQIFHAAWWIDEKGNNPPYYTVITYKDIQDGKYRPIIKPAESIEYVENLEKNAKKSLVIWPYHCIIGTPGNALENQFSNIINYHSLVRKSVIQKMVKGTNPLTEMYGIIRSEDSDGTNFSSINIEFLNKLENYDKIIIAGEAKSHCVYESIKQILEYYKDRKEITSKIYILEDCMSSINGYEQATEDAFKDFKANYDINLVKSDSFAL